MDKEWKMDFDIPDIGTLVTLLSTAITSAIMGVGNVVYVILILTTAYEAKGKEFFFSLIKPGALLTIEAQFVLYVGTFLLISASFFFLTMLISIYETHAVSKKERRGRLKIIFISFVISMLCIFIALLFTLSFRYTIYY